MLGGAVGRYAAGLAKTHGVATTFAIAGDKKKKEMPSSAVSCFLDV